MDHFARGLLPLLCTLCVVVISAVPTRLPMLPLIAPALSLIAVYYWTIYRPDLLNTFYILLLGALQDMLTGSPVGVTSFILLLTYLVVVSQRRFFHGKSFGVVWWGFMLVAFAAVVLTWIIHVILSGQFIDPRGATFGLMLTILLYPPLAALLSQAHKAVPARDSDA
ncbi:MAG: rod shape-determining protein MreD [Alphaproteobacteria bacterium]|nr:rod shape-determining protein MreD [Alphaproteobacteria bacterium]